MNVNWALWERGDFTQITEAMRESGDRLVETFEISKGLKVLDLGWGDGTTAIPEAHHGADVLGIDTSSNLVAAGNQRAEIEGLPTTGFKQAVHRICRKCRIIASVCA